VLHYKVLQKMSALASCFPNVFVTSQVVYFYAGYETIQIEQVLMACAFYSRVSKDAF
jgi:hypothetical protein